MIDETFHYKVKANSYLAICRVRINSNAVVATELPDNTGMSITNASVEVALLVCHFYEIPLSELVWIEHYPTSSGIDEEFDLVEFQIEHNCFNKPTSKPIPRTIAEKLIGCLL